MKHFKVFYILLIGVFIFISCSKDNELLKNVFEENQIQPEALAIDTVIIGDSIIDILVDESKRPPVARSYYYDDSELYQLVDFPINIVVRENNSNARYLTHRDVINKEMYLRDYDEKNQVSQTFYLKTVPLSGEFYLESEARIASGFIGLTRPRTKVIVSVGAYSSAPNTKVLYAKGGTNLTGARWDLSPSKRIGGGAFIFYNSDLFESGSSNWWDIYNLCIGASGTNIIFGKYMQKGTQEFEIRPKEEFSMTSLELIVDNASYAVKKPDFYVNWDYNNNVDREQSMSTNFSTKAVRTSSFSRKHNVTLAVSSTLKVGGAFFIGGEISTSISTSNEWTYGTSEQKEDSRSYNFPLTIPARTRVLATLYVARYEMNLRYKAVFKGKLTGKLITEYGDWQGVDCTDIKVDVQSTDSYGNKKTRTFNNIPTSLVRL